MALRRDGIIGGKDLPLEALRGLAAVSVLLWHCLLAFFPQWSGDGDWPRRIEIFGQLWFGLIHGPAAVTLFFVLSGYVLTRRHLLAGDGEIILRGALKRWPRLAGPVLVAVMASWLLFASGAYRFQEAGAAVGSRWLADFAYGFSSPHAQPFEPRLLGAVAQGAFLTFFRGDSSYDSVLWTMRYELAGSYIAFALALPLAQAPRERRDLRLAIVAIAGLLCHYVSAICAAFPAGVAIAAFAPERRIATPTWLFTALVAVSIYLFGYAGAGLGAFAAPAGIFGAFAPVNIHIVASVIIIVALECAPASVRARLSGRAAWALGAMSFPLYLVHILAICSVGSAAFLWARAAFSTDAASAVATIVTICASFVAATPLVYFNERWLRVVDLTARRLLSCGRESLAQDGRE